VSRTSVGYPPHQGFSSRGVDGRRMNTKSITRSPTVAKRLSRAAFSLCSAWAGSSKSFSKEKSRSSDVLPSKPRAKARAFLRRLTACRLIHRAHESSRQRRLVRANPPLKRPRRGPRQIRGNHRIPATFASGSGGTHSRGFSAVYVGNCACLCLESPPLSMPWPWHRLGPAAAAPNRPCPARRDPRA
jgi:hypothetical protein